MIEIAKMVVIQDPQNALLEEIDGMFRPEVLRGLGTDKDWKEAVDAVKNHCERIIHLCDQALNLSLMTGSNSLDRK